MVSVKHRGKQSGVATFFIVMILAMVASIVAISSVDSQLSKQMIASNTLRENQAFEAAEAGLEYGIAHLKDNHLTILVDADNNGEIEAYSNAQTMNVPQANGTSYSITYTNPFPFNFELIEVSSTGVSSDGQISQTVSQQVRKVNYLQAVPPAGFIAKGDVAMGGNMTITNTETGKTILSGGSVSLSGSAETNGGSISSDKKNINSDVTQNDSSIASLSGDAFFMTYFSMSKSQVKENADVVYTNSSNTNYSSLLNGVTNKVIWIDQSTGGTARLSGNATIGSISAPVILIIDGDFKANGSTTIYGAVYVTPDWHNSGGGNLEINGSVITEGQFSGTGTPDVTFSSSILNNTYGFAEFFKVPGTWHDS